MRKFPKITKNERLDLLKEPTNTWGYREIMMYFDYSQGKATKLMEKCEAPKMYQELSRNKRVFINSVLDLFGTTKEKEIKFLGGLNK